MTRRLYLSLSLLLLVPCSLSWPTKHVKRAKRYVDYTYEVAEDYDGDFGLLPGEVDNLRDMMIELMDLLDDGDGQDDSSSSYRLVNDESEPVVIIVVEDENQDPNDMTLASLLYNEEEPWSRCTRSCTTRRYRECLYESLCGTEPLAEEAFCYAPGSRCEKTVNDYLKKEGYIVVDYNEDHIDDGDDPEEDPDYVPEYEAGLDYDYDESVLYPDAADNTIGDYYDYGWADYMAGNTGGEGAEEVPEDTYEYTYEDPVEEGQEEEEEEKFGYEGCGKRGVKTTDGMQRIMGGRIAQRGAWPWQVAVMNRFKETFCGGTLVGSRWVLTAAHCKRSRINVRLGEHDLYAYDKSEIEMRVEKFIGHPDYSDETFENDIALLKLPRDVDYNRYIVPACLPSSKTPPPMRSQCIVSGWGKEKDTHIFGSEVLKYVRVPIVTKQACTDSYPEHPITRNMFCAGFRKGMADTCSGDSGGPLVCDDLGAWTIHGVTSFGEGCGDRGKFGVYTKVKNYLGWIKKVMRENS